MDPSLHIKSSPKGPPQAVIPNHCMWDFAEYLAFQRVQVVYTYRGEHVLVSFPRMDRAGVQKLLDEWVACSGRAESAALSS
jgi:hypothetical protein